MSLLILMLDALVTLPRFVRVLVDSLDSIHGDCGVTIDKRKMCIYTISLLGHFRQMNYKLKQMQYNINNNL